MVTGVRYAVDAASFSATGTTSVTSTVIVDIATLPSLSSTRYPSGVVVPAKAASGSRVTRPSLPTLHVPSPAATTATLYVASAGSRSRTVAGASVARLPGTSLTSGSIVTSTFWAVRAVSGWATGAVPTVTERAALPVVPFVSDTR